MDKHFLFALFIAFVLGFFGNQNLYGQVIASNSNKVYTYLQVDERPQFPGGNTALHDFMHTFLVYPFSGRENFVEGDVWVSFIVGPDGSIDAPVIIKSVEREFDLEVLRVISQMPRWKPGKLNGQEVPVRIILPIRFRLNS